MDPEAQYSVQETVEAIEAQLREAEQRLQAKKVQIVLLEVAPNMRRHVVGPQGETLRKLAQEHPSVKVTVPPPSDTQSPSISIRGPRDETAAVEGFIKARLHAV